MLTSLVLHIHLLDFNGHFSLIMEQAILTPKVLGIFFFIKTASRKPQGELRKIGDSFRLLTIRSCS